MARVRCLCPPAGGGPRHPDGDDVALRPMLTFHGAVAARHAVSALKAERPDAGVPDVLAVLTEAYLCHGVASWTIEDASGAAVPVTPEAVRSLLLPELDVSLALADEADALYTEAVLLPLAGRASRSSRSGPTAGSTPARTGSTPSPRRRSSPSSTASTPTGGTGTTP